MTFPDDWPDGCPGVNVPEAEGVLFRIVKGDPPTPDDLRSHHETGRLPRADPCLRCGLSVFRELADAQNQRSLMPRLGGWVATGTLRAVHGKACLTPGSQPTHTTWWPHVGVDRVALFTVVVGEVT